MSRSWASGSTRQWRKIRALVLIRDGGQCQIKGPRCTVIAREVDHIVPKSRGGPDHATNLRAVCRPCHKARQHEQWDHLPTSREW